MSNFINILITGIVSGAIYSMLAAGLALSFSTTGIFNLGYGAVAFTSAFIYFELETGLHWANVWAGLMTVLVFAPLLGLALDRLIFRKLNTKDEAPKIMVAVGVLIAVPALAEFIVNLLISVGHFNIPNGSLVALAPGIGPIPADNYTFGPIHLNSNQFIVAGVALVMAVGLGYLLKGTRMGLKMRAVVDRPELAEARGVDRNRTSQVAWLLGTVLAALAGVAGAPIFNSLTTYTYLLILLAAAAAAVLGGFRSVPLAAGGGLLIGAFQSIVARYATFAQNLPGFDDAVPFVLLLVGLVIWGRERGRRAGLAAEDVPPPDYLADVPQWRKTGKWVFWFALMAVYTFFIGNGYWVSIMTTGLALALVFLSFTIVTGTGGIVSLAQAAFVTSAGLIAGTLIVRYHQNYVVALIAGVAFAMVLGMIVAIPALRLGGLALALATLALGFVCDSVLFQWSWLAGPLQAGWKMPRPSLFGIHFTSDKSLAGLLLIIVIVVTLLIRNLQRSPWGRMMSAVRASEPAAETSGISGVAVKFVLFAVAAALAGLGGVFLVTVNQSVNNSTYTTITGLTWLATVVLWGVRRPGGAIAAAVFSAVFTGFIASGFHFASWLAWSGTTSPWLPQALFGIGAITMAKNPDGGLAIGDQQAYARRQKRLARREARLAAAQAAVAPAGVAVAGAGGPSAPIVAPMPAPIGDAAAPAPRELAAAATERAPSGPIPEDVVLRAEGVSASYGDVQALFDIDLDVRRSRITALVGANGAGKSTLCRVLAGLMKPAAGRVFLDGDDITHQPAHSRVPKLLLAPESRGIFPSLSVEDNLALLLADPADREVALDRFPSLRDRRKIPAGNLSGGEQQMLTMAPVLVRRPDLLIADEPTLGLAPLIVEEIMRLFAELRDEGVTILVVEERAKAVLDIADDVALLELGRVVWRGRREELDDEMLAAIHLGQSKVEAPA